jgi:hypothetical protein
LRLPTRQFVRFLAATAFHVNGYPVNSFGIGFSADADYLNRIMAVWTPERECMSKESWHKNQAKEVDVYDQGLRGECLAFTRQVLTDLVPHNRKTRLALSTIHGTYQATLGHPAALTVFRPTTPRFGLGRHRCIGALRDIGVRQDLQKRRMVRSSGFEPPRYCYRQPLKLVRLPVPPRPHRWKASSIVIAPAQTIKTRTFLAPANQLAEKISFSGGGGFPSPGKLFLVNGASAPEVRGAHFFATLKPQRHFPAHEQFCSSAHSAREKYQPRRCVVRAANFLTTNLLWREPFGAEQGNQV